MKKNKTGFFTRMMLVWTLSGLIALLSLGGCAGDESLQITGDWTDQFSTNHTINETNWDMAGAGWSSTFQVLTWNNATQHLIAQNGSTNAWSADLYSRFDWAGFDGVSFYYCQTAYNAATQADAEAVLRADDTNPATSGCGVFPWTLVTLPAGI